MKSAAVFIAYCLHVTSGNAVTVVPTEVAVALERE